MTGAGGLIGSEACRALVAQGHQVIGVDNNMREYFFGADGSTAWNIEQLSADLAGDFINVSVDIRDRAAIEQLVRENATDLGAIVHAAAQPSHDWAAREPHTDFEINAVGTLNVLEAVRQFAPETPFVFCSTNKVYGDRPNSLPLIELDTRYELPADHQYFGGIAEDMSIDHSLHSVFGASKVAADIMVQEYGRYFGIPTVCFRGGTLTGPQHSASELHGFIAYLVRACLGERQYNIFGYQGKQVRDAIHSSDFVSAVLAVIDAPRVGEVYNMGGGRFSHASMIEAIALVEQRCEKTLNTTYVDANRIGDHIWWVGDNSKFESHYPNWHLTYDLPAIIDETVSANRTRWSQ